MKKFINKKPFFIAEISANHNGLISNAIKLIDLAKKCGADAVKLQTYTADMMTLKNTNYKIKEGLWKNIDLWKLYNEAKTPLDWHKKLFNYAKKKNIKIFSTPFSVEALKFLEKLNCKAYKISSFEMNDLNLIKEVAKTKKPMIISTGLSDLDEIKKTFEVAKSNGCKDLTLLYCVSNYPSQEEDFNLNNIKILKKKFNCKIGLSDHSLGSKVSEFAIFCGAEIFEKHIALKGQKKGYDIKFSLKGKEIAEYKKKLQEAYSLVKHNNFFRSKKEMKNNIFRRSIYSIKEIKKGDVLSKKNIKTYRPNIGLPANHYFDILGKKSPYRIKKNEPLSKSFLKKL